MVIVSILIAALALDYSLGSAATVTSLASIMGVDMFYVIVAIFAISQYFILQYVKQKSKETKGQSTYFQFLNKAVTLVQYVLIAFIILVALQIGITSKYSTILITWSTGITLNLGALVMAILAQRFIVWYKSSKSFVVLLYGISSATVSLSLVLTFVYTAADNLGLSAERTLNSQTVNVFYPTGSAMGVVQFVWATSDVINFVLLWASTILLLRQYSQKLGRVRLWIVLSIPLVAFAISFVVVTPLLSFLPTATIDKFYLSIFGYTMPGLAGGILFGVPFFIVARTIDPKSAVRSYLIIAASGLVLLQITTSSSIGPSPYPPFGYASVLSTGLSCYLIFIGLYYSAVSISENVNLRKSIRELALDQSRLLDSIGSAHMESEIRNRVLKITKEQADILTEQSGVDSALSDDDISQYMQQVMDEIKNKKK